MNRPIKSIMLLALCILISVGLFAQIPLNRKDKARPKIPRWVSEKGYWVVETNIHTPKNHTVWFYSNENELMYKESIDGVKLNVESRRVKMKLKKALETSAASWQQATNDQKTTGFEDRAIVKSVL